MEEEQLLCILQKCVKSEMIYHLFSSQVGSVFGEWQSLLEKLHETTQLNSKTEVKVVWFS